MTVDATVSEKVEAFHSAGKPIGMCCIAPVIAAKLIPGVEVTVGGSLNVIRTRITCHFN